MAGMIPLSKPKFDLPSAQLLARIWCLISTPRINTFDDCKRHGPFRDLAPLLHRPSHLPRPTQIHNQIKWVLLQYAHGQAPRQFASLALKSNELLGSVQSYEEWKGRCSGELVRHNERTKGKKN